MPAPPRSTTSTRKRGAPVAQSVNPPRGGGAASSKGGGSIRRGASRYAPSTFIDDFDREDEEEMKRIRLSADVNFGEREKPLPKLSRDVNAAEVLYVVRVIIDGVLNGLLDPNELDPPLNQIGSPEFMEIINELNNAERMSKRYRGTFTAQELIQYINSQGAMRMMTHNDLMAMLARVLSARNRHANFTPEYFFTTAPTPTVLSGETLAAGGEGSINPVSQGRSGGLTAREKIKFFMCHAQFANGRNYSTFDQQLERYRRDTEAFTVEASKKLKVPDKNLDPANISRPNDDDPNVRVLEIQRYNCRIMSAFCMRVARQVAYGRNGYNEDHFDMYVLMLILALKYYDMALMYHRSLKTEVPLTLEQEALARQEAQELHGGRSRGRDPDAEMSGSGSDSAQLYSTYGEESSGDDDERMSEEGEDSVRRKKAARGPARLYTTESRLIVNSLFDGTTSGAGGDDEEDTTSGEGDVLDDTCNRLSIRTMRKLLSENDRAGSNQYNHDVMATTGSGRIRLLESHRSDAMSEMQSTNVMSVPEAETPQASHPPPLNPPVSEGNVVVATEGGEKQNEGGEETLPTVSKEDSAGAVNASEGEATQTVPPDAAVQQLEALQAGKEVDAEMNTTAAMLRETLLVTAKAQAEGVERNRQLNEALLGGEVSGSGGNKNNGTDDVYDMLGGGSGDPFAGGPEEPPIPTIGMGEVIDDPNAGVTSHYACGTYMPVSCATGSMSKKNRAAANKAMMLIQRQNDMLRNRTRMQTTWMHPLYVFRLLTIPCDYNVEQMNSRRDEITNLLTFGQRTEMGAIMSVSRLSFIADRLIGGTTLPDAFFRLTGGVYKAMNADQTVIGARRMRTYSSRGLVAVDMRMRPYDDIQRTGGVRTVFRNLDSNLMRKLQVPPEPMPTECNKVIEDIFRRHTNSARSAHFAATEAKATCVKETQYPRMDNSIVI